MIDLKKLVRPNILSLQPYSSARSEFSGTSEIWLDANENPFGNLNRYPDPVQSALKNRLSEIKKCATDQIFIGNGSDEAIDLCFRIFCEPGRDKAVIFTPTYGMYQVSADINDVEIIEVPLNADFQIDFDAFSKLDRLNIKMLLLCSPNNPTGNRLENLERILSEFDGIVVLDEAYADFAAENSLLPKLSDFPNLIILQTLSKAWGLAALRIGMAFASLEIIAIFNKVKPPYNIGTVPQQLALTALGDMTGFDGRLRLLLEERTKLESKLEQLDSVERIFASDANFILVKFRDAARVYKSLVTAGIVVRNRSAQIPDTLRISIGTPQENQKLVQTLKNIK